jgi:hypothetical protein
MSLCIGCDQAKDNGEAYCEKCDPTGELNHSASDPSVRRARERAREIERREAELATLKGEKN